MLIHHFEMNIGDDSEIVRYFQQRRFLELFNFIECVISRSRNHSEKLIMKYRRAMPLKTSTASTFRCIWTAHNASQQPHLNSNNLVAILRDKFEFNMRQCSIQSIRFDSQQQWTWTRASASESIVWDECTLIIWRCDLSNGIYHSLCWRRMHVLCGYFMCLKSRFTLSVSCTNHWPLCAQSVRRNSSANMFNVHESQIIMIAWQMANQAFTIYDTLQYSVAI